MNAIPSKFSQFLVLFLGSADVPRGQLGLWRVDVITMALSIIDALKKTTQTPRVQYKGSFIHKTFFIIQAVTTQLKITVGLGSRLQGSRPSKHLNWSFETSREVWVWNLPIDVFKVFSSVLSVKKSDSRRLIA